MSSLRAICNSYKRCLSTKEAALAHKELWGVEQAFRNLKMDLDIYARITIGRKVGSGPDLIYLQALVMESYLALKLRITG